MAAGVPAGPQGVAPAHNLVERLVSPDAVDDKRPIPKVGFWVYVPLTDWCLHNLLPSTELRHTLRLTLAVGSPTASPESHLYRYRSEIRTKVWTSLNTR